jgi:hypothetical protein
MSMSLTLLFIRQNLLYAVLTQSVSLQLGYLLKALWLFTR